MTTPCCINLDCNGRERIATLTRERDEAVAMAARLACRACHEPPCMDARAWLAARKAKECPACGGRGGGQTEAESAHRSTCHACNGTGRTR